MVENGSFHLSFMESEKEYQLEVRKKKKTKTKRAEEVWANMK